MSKFRFKTSVGKRYGNILSIRLIYRYLKVDIGNIKEQVDVDIDFPKALKASFDESEYRPKVDESIVKKPEIPSSPPKRRRKRGLFGFFG